MAPFAWGDALPVLAGGRIRLRPLRAADAPDVFAVFSDPEVVRYRDSELMASPSDAERYVADVDEYFARRELFEWAIADSTTDRVLGTATLLHLEPRHGRAEIGFALARAQWGKGLARETVSTLVGFAFQQLGLHRIEADVDPRNDRSLRMLERLGFVREGLLRERHRTTDGMQDSVVFGLLRHEWDGVL